MDYMIRANRSSKIKDLGDLLKGQHLTADVEVAGITWTLRTLSPRDMFEADALVSEVSQVQAARSLNRARVSFAISLIDGQPLSAHFKVPDAGLSEDDKKMLEDPDNLRIWTHTELYRFLMEDGQDELFTVLLEAYQNLLKRKTESIGAIPGFSKRTTSGAS